MAFDLQRGTNVSHWLSQSKRRGDERRRFFTADDVRRVAEFGFDHIRLPIDEEQMFADTGQPEAEAFDLLDAALDWCDRANLRVVVDMHILRSHYFNDADQPRLYSDPDEVERFCALWRAVSDRLKRRSTDQVAYEILNEPVARDPSDWNRVSRAVFDALRGQEPSRTIVLGSNHFQQVHMMPHLDVPDDENLMLSFHFYEPMYLTHYKARWWGPSVHYDGPVNYPGTTIPAEQYQMLSTEARGEIDRQRLNRNWDRDELRSEIQPALDKRDQTGRPLYCGEFGCYATTPLETRQRWLADMVSLFAQEGIAWANWDYKGRFGLVDADGADSGIARSLLGG
jgi:endoglucanase